MKIVDDNPSAPDRARPAEFLYRPLGAAAEPDAAHRRARAICQRRHAAAHGACRLSCARRTRMRASSAIDTAAAKQAPGVIAVVTGAELAKVITPWVGVLTHLKGIKSAPQYAIAVDRACWQGEAVCAVVAKTRAQAEDACELVEVTYEELPAVTDAETALDAGTPVIHPELGDNLTFERKHEAGEPDKGFADADEVVEATFLFGRHTGVCNEPRAIVADWNPGEQRLTVVSRDAGAAHDAEPVRQASRAGRAAGARHHQGRRRLVRHQGAHLRGRDGDGRAVEAAAAPGEVRRRPAGKLRHRHPCARSSRQGEDRREAGRHDHRLGDRRSHRHRAVFGLSAHLRHRGQSGRQPDRRAVHLPELSRARARRVPEQERDVPVPRGRPSDRDRA